jgi:D-xylose transport system ATP-binding protein
VVLGKNILHLHKILILDEPTKGIDVGAKREFHSLMCRIAEKNVGVIMVSSELPEILGMSDRIIVMHEGEKTGEFMRSEATQENIMNAAIGNVQNSFTGAH